MTNPFIKDIPCPYCSLKWYSLDGLKVHIKLKHNKKNEVRE